MQAIFETAFDIIYLCTVITLGIIMICKSKGRRQYLLYGIMAVGGGGRGGGGGGGRGGRAPAPPPF